MLACTATATPITREAIVEALGLEPASTDVIVRGFARPNLALSVIEVEGPRETRLLTSRALTDALGSRRKPRGAGIVYAGTRKGTERIAEALRDDGFSAHAYHAGMPGEDRTEVANRFASGAIDIVVATNAFGMGIDRPDVRIVVHAQPPASLEAYYQEVGRAGRDGDPASGILYTSPADLGLRRRLIELDRDGGGADEAAIARAWALFRELLRYVDARSCRHDFILGYFGDEAESLGGCGRCDVCLLRAHAADDPDKAARDCETVRKALAGVARAQRRGGMQAIAQMLCGIGSEKVKRFGFDDLSTFGILAGLDERAAIGVLRATIAAGYVGLTPTEHPVPFLTLLGGKVMRAETPNEILLADRPRKVARRPIAQRDRVLEKSRRRTTSREEAEGSGEERSARRTGELADVDASVVKRFEALRAERARLAKEAKVPPYVVAHDRALMALAERAPSDVEEMEAVPGWGPTKVAKWGAALLGAMGG